MAEAARKHTHGLVVESPDELPPDICKKYMKAPTVGVATKVISITQLDMAEHTFHADINVNVAWSGDKTWVGEDSDGIAKFLQLYNHLEGDDPDISAVKPGKNGFDWYVRFRFKGTFRQRYHLQNFPLDVQDLIVRVRLKKECRLVHLAWGPTGEAFSIDNGAIQDDFHLEQAYVRPQYHPSFKFGKLAGYDPEALVIFRMRRKPNYWITNYGAMVSAICTFCFAAFCLPVGELGDRLGVGFTLNLTVVATFYLMQDKLPPVPYWTVLDKHMMSCICFTMLVMLINCLPALLGEDFITRIENGIILVLIIIWVCYHFYAYSRLFSLRKEDGMHVKASPQQPKQQNTGTRESAEDVKTSTVQERKTQSRSFRHKKSRRHRDR